MAPTTQQVALVIGASRGIGRQVAIDLATNGYAGKQHFTFNWVQYGYLTNI
jgi:NAD(P)-dependent dehydrogenase (short-subunit alcohol dehydrogenase family)